MTERIGLQCSKSLVEWRFVHRDLVAELMRIALWLVSENGM